MKLLELEIAFNENQFSYNLKLFREYIIIILQIPSTEIEDWTLYFELIENILDAIRSSYGGGTLELQLKKLILSKIRTFWAKGNHDPFLKACLIAIGTFMMPLEEVKEWLISIAQNEEEYLKEDILSRSNIVRDDVI